MNLPVPTALIGRTWRSPTLMTWASLLPQILRFLVLLPLILTSFSIEDIALWFLLNTIISLQVVSDLGFTPTFSRVIAFALGGVAPEELRGIAKTRPQKSDRPTNIDSLSQTCSSARIIYKRIAYSVLFTIGTIGTFAVIGPISQSSDPLNSWLAWIIIVLTMPTSMFSSYYRSFLTGTNHIAALRRSEAFIGFAAAGTTILAVLLGGGLLSIIVVSRAWVIISYFVIRRIAISLDDYNVVEDNSGNISKDIWNAVWPSAWRSGIGILTLKGAVYLSGIIYAQYGEPGDVATYLLALRLIETLSGFSQAPFYTKLPTIARLHVQGKSNEQISIARKGMFWGYMVFATGFITIGIAGNWLLTQIGSNAQFPDHLLWSLLGCATFVERYGAMHLQFYSTTNHIVWHISASVTGAIWLIATIVLAPILGVYAFPTAMLTGYLGFYMWYSNWHSYHAFHLRIIDFDIRSLALPASMLVLYISYGFVHRLVLISH